MITVNMPTRKQRIDKIMLDQTTDNAIAWYEEVEKFVFCIDLLEISAHDADADKQVNRLEKKYDGILKRIGITDSYCIPCEMKSEARMIINAYKVLRTVVAENIARDMVQPGTRGRTIIAEQTKAIEKALYYRVLQK